jgi:O-antigen/teichoic acid export membrane protein
VTKGILAGVAAGWLQSAVRVLVGLLQVRLIIDYLGDDLSGVWFLFLSLGAFVAFFDLGLSPTLSREIGFLLGGSRDEEAKRRGIADLLATSQRVFQVLAASVFVLGLAGGLFFLDRVAPAGSRDSVRVAWVVFCAGASANILGNAAFAALYGLGRAGVERSMQALVQLLGFAMLCVAIACDAGLTGLAVAWIVQGLLLRLLGWWALRRLHPEHGRGDGRPSTVVARKLAGPSFKWMLMALGATLIFSTDNILIGSLLGTGSVPAYHALVQVITLALTLSLLTVTSSTPFVSRAHAAGDEEQVVGLLLNNVRFGMGVMILIAAVLFVHGDLLVEVWLGPGRFAGWAVLAVLVTTMLLETHHRIHAAVVMARGELVFHGWALSAGVLNLVLSVILGRSLGLLGIALGTLCAQALTSNWRAPYCALRRLELPWAGYLLRTCLPLGALLLVATLAGFGTRSVLPPDWPALLRLVLGCGVTAAAGVLFFAAVLARPSERAAALRLLRRLLVSSPSGAR